MSIKVPRPLLFILSFILTLVFYWPSLNGTPIWDDFNFWFTEPIMKPEVSYFLIWKDFAWPFSVSAQKFLLSIFQKNYLVYHLINLLLHFANSYLVYLLGKKLNLKFPFLYFLLFLLHPVAVISTAWMIQIKTLLCFFFALLSLLTFIEGQKNWRWLIPSFLFFFLSITSKSASLTLPLIFLCLSFRETKFKKLHFLLPFFLIAFWNGHKVLTSPVTIEGTERAKSVTDDKIEEPQKKKIVEEIERIADQEPSLIEDVTEVVPEITSTENEIFNPFASIHINVDLTLRTMYYYFWQSLLPTHNAPVKGLNFEKAGFEEYLHVVFLIIVSVVLWKDLAFILLLGAHFLLLPFLGIVPAPFMSITWVSDQHLYLVLPAILGFWIMILQKIPWQKKGFILLPFVLLYSLKTFEATPMYKDQFSFYRASLDYNPYNVPMSYNLGFAYIMNGKWTEGYHVVSDAFYLANNEPQMKENRFYPYLALLYFQMRQGLEKKNEN